MISQLEDNVRFTLCGWDGIFIKKTRVENQTKHRHLFYYKEGLEDVCYSADKPIKETLPY